MIKYYSKLGVAFGLFLLLTACEIIVPKKIEVKEEEVLAKYEGVELKDIMNDVQKKFQKAKDGEMYFYSPNNYRTARTGIQAARAYFRNPEKKTYVLTSLYRADKALDDSFEVKKIVVRELDDHIKVRDFLVELEVQKTHNREYRSLLTSLLSIVERIEKDKEALFKDPSRKADIEERKTSVMNDLLDFRLRVVKFKFLNRGELLIAESDYYDAKNNVPQTFARTVAARDKAVKYITENVENLDGVSAVAQQFEYEAERLLHIARAVDTVMKLEKNTHEQYILSWEENLAKIAKALKEPQLQYYSFAVQTSKFAGAIKRIIEEKQTLALQVAELKSGGEATEPAGTDATNEGATPAENVAQKDSAQENKNQEQKGLEVVPLDGDPEQIKKSLRILTDQVYQLTVEKTAWENERAALKSQIKKLQSAQKKKTQPKAEPKPKSTEGKKADGKTLVENKPEARTESTSKAENKAEPETETAPEANKTESAKSD